MRSDNGPQTSVLSLIDLTDETFVLPLTDALAAVSGGQAVVLVNTTAESDATLGVGHSQSAQWLEQIGRFSFSRKVGEADKTSMDSQGGHWQWSIKGCQALPMILGSSCLVVAFRHGAAADYIREEVTALWEETSGNPDALFEGFAEIAALGRAVLAADDGTPAIFQRPGSAQSAEWREFDACGSEVLVAEARRWCGGQAGVEAGNWIVSAQLDSPSLSARWARLSFCPELIIGISANGNNSLSSAIEAISDDVLRAVVGAILASGLKTAMTPFPESSADFEALLIELRKLDENDLLNRLVIGGFANHPVGEGEDQIRCQECIYYLTHRRWCDLPELPIAVEPDWYCRLWRL